MNRGEGGRDGAAGGRGQGAGSVAVVDCGTNSTRLLIASVADGRVHSYERHTMVTRLGASVDRAGQLDDLAIARTVSAVRGYARRWRMRGVERVVISATSAVRDVDDADRFLEGVERAAGVRPMVLTGEQEARLTFIGASSAREDAGRRVVCDVGGGSTELVVGTHRPERWVSLRLGSVRLTERWLRHDPPTPDEYARLIADAEAGLAGLGADFTADGRALLIAVAGSPTVLAALYRGMTSFSEANVDGTVMQAAELAQVVEDLAWIPSSERLKTGVITPGREDVIVAGGLLLSTIMRLLGFVAVEVRVADLLDGLALQSVADEEDPR